MLRPLLGCKLLFIRFVRLTNFRTEPRPSLSAMKEIHKDLSMRFQHFNETDTATREEYFQEIFKPLIVRLTPLCIQP